VCWPHPRAISTREWEKRERRWLGVDGVDSGWMERLEGMEGFGRLSEKKGKGEGMK
jgi:hypothetical protein